MPIYEYLCGKCDKVFEEWTKQAEEADVTHPCPDCLTQCRRLMSRTVFVLAGGGWYATDYGNRRPSVTGEKTSDMPSSSPETASDSSQSSSPAAAAG